MIYLFLFGIVLVVTGLYGIQKASENEDENWSVGVYVIAMFSSIFGVFLLFCVSILSYSYMASGYKAEILNREYGTDYTAAEVFYGDDVIDRIQEIKRTRVELNGNLFSKESGQ